MSYAHQWSRSGMLLLILIGLSRLLLQISWNNSSGGSIREVIQLLEKHQGNILGVGILLDRSGGKVKFDYPLRPLAVTDVQNYQPEECPMCQRGEPLVKPGSRKLK